jgi:hypothetical protein
VSSFYADEGTAAHKIFEACMRNRKMTAASWVGKTIDTTQTRTHAPYAPSNSKQWLTCPGSVKYLDQVRPFTKKQEGMKIKVTVEMAEAVQQAVDYARDLCVSLKEKPQLFIEHEVFIPVTKDKGHLDLAIWFPVARHLHVMDYKHGVGIVFASKNTQLQLYTLGLMAKLKPVTITLHVMQPRCTRRENPFDTWDVTPRELVAFELYAKKQIALSKKDDAPFAPDEDTCRWCEPTTCHAAIAKAANAARSDFSEFIEGKAPRKMEKAIGVKQLAAMKANMPFLLMFARSLDEAITAKLEKGVKVPGWCLAPGRSNRQWKDEEAAAAALLKIFPAGKFMDRKPRLLGIPAIEKALPAAKREAFLKKHTIKPIGNPTLQPDRGGNATDDFQDDLL